MLDESQEMGTDKTSLSLKAELVTKKMNWIKKNQRILTTLYNCCAMQGIGGENLPGKEAG